ncbi:MAG: STAS domain-containing protein, partial [Aliifodinibius sp.]|nr:STAS domain-containing protein [Fodinibius sp.]NIV14802.1 STAS domain-containing protein [Fodinibius sp.]NIY28680.1 STAS domain-containing protein [Fodinibius sp.]
MEFIQENINNITVIRLEGNVMGGPEAVKLNEEINQLLDKQKKKLVIDLGRVSRMNSSGLGILINALTT